MQDVDERFKVVPNGVLEVAGEHEQHCGHEVPGTLYRISFALQHPNSEGAPSVFSGRLLGPVHARTCRKPNRPAALTNGASRDDSTGISRCCSR